MTDSWELIRLSEDGCGFEQIAKFESIEECLSRKLEEKEYYVYSGITKNDLNEINNIVEKVNSLNNDKLKLVINNDFRSMNTCYCVVESNGSRHKECSYCNENGYCWLVPSGSC